VIRVTVTLSGPLRHHYRTGPSAKAEEVELAAGSTVDNLLTRCGIPPEKAHLIVINRHRADRRTALNDGDHVRVLPLAAGG